MSAKSIVLCLSVLFAGSRVAHAQVRVEWEHVHTASSNPNLAARAATTGPADGFYVSGAEYADNASWPGPNFNPRRPFLLRLGSAGNIVWARTPAIPFGVSSLPVVLATSASGDALLGFTGNGAAAGDRLSFTGFGAGATLTQVGLSDSWRIDYGVQSETLRLVGVTSLHATDYALA